MRNLKRALSLAMATFMLLGMMVVSAGAVSYNDFSDKEEIVNTEAVNTMVSLGVIAGRDTGEFDPTGVVTRGEMAKLIAVMLNGGKDPTLGSVTTAFTDAKDHWAEAYIAYCANLGILNGYGDNTVKPDGIVTGTEAAKMLLTALGYRSDIEKLTGVQWVINTNVLANKVDLYDGVDVNPAEGLTRDDTAQMIYNAVQANEVEYRNNYGEYAGVIYAQPINGVENDSTVLWTRFKVQKVEGVVVANETYAIDGGAKTVAGKTRLTDIYYNGKLHANTTSGNTVTAVKETYPVAIDNELMGRRIVIYVKGLKNLSPNAVDAQVVGTPILSNQNLIAETTGKLTTSAKVDDFVTSKGLAISTNNVGINTSANAFAHGVLHADYTGSKVSTSAPVLTDGINDEGPGKVTTFIDHDGDGAVDYIMTETARMAKVTVYDETNKKLTVAGVGSIDFKNVGDADAVAKDDVVLYVKYGETYYMEKAETVSGKFDAYNASSEKLRLDGTEYGTSAVKLDNASAPTLETYTAEEELVGDTYTLYLDGYGNAVAQEMTEEAIGNYAVVLGYAGTAADPGVSVLNKGEVKLLQADGTTGTYTVNLLASANKFNLGGSNSDKEIAMTKILNGTASDATGTPAYAAHAIRNMAVTYTVGADGKVILGDPDKLSNYVSVNTAGSNGEVKRATTNYSFTHNAAGVAEPNTVTVNDNTIFFFVDETGRAAGRTIVDAKVVNGLSSMPNSAVKKSIAANADPTTAPNAAVLNAVYDSRTGNSKVAKVVVFDASFAGTTNFLYLADDYTGTRNENGETIYTYPVVFDTGEKGSIETTDNTKSSGKVYGYINDGKRTVLTDLQGNTDGTGQKGATFNGFFTTYARGNAINIEWGREQGISNFPLTLASDVKVINVEGEPYATSVSDGNTVALATNSDGLVKVIFVKATNVEYRTVTNKTGGTIAYESVAVDGTKSYPTLANDASIKVATGFAFKALASTGGMKAAMRYTTIHDNGDKLNEEAKSSGSKLPPPENKYLVGPSMPAYANVEVTFVDGITGGGGGGGGAIRDLDGLSTITEIQAALDATGVTTVNVAGNYTASGLITVPTGKTLNFDALDSGAHGVRVSGTGVLNVANTYTTTQGAIVGTVNVGTLVSASDLFITGNLTIKNAVTGSGDITGNVTVDGSLTVKDGTNKNITLASNMSLIARGAGSITAADVTVSGNGVVKIEGTGASTLGAVVTAATGTATITSTGGNTVASIATSNGNVELGSTTLTGALTAGSGTLEVVNGDVTVTTHTSSGAITVTAGKLLVGTTATPAAVTAAVSVDGEFVAGAVTGTLTMTGSGKATVTSVSGAIVDTNTSEISLTGTTAVTLASGTTTLLGKVTFNSDVTLAAALTIGADAVVTTEKYTTGTNATTLNGKLTVGDATITTSTGTITLAAGGVLTINGTAADVGSGFITGVNGSKVVFGSSAVITTVTGSNFKAANGSTDITTTGTDFQGKTFTHNGTAFVAGA